MAVPGLARLRPSRFLSAVKEMQPELRHLRAFLAVADQGSATGAGAALFRAPSAGSRSIHKLERELGVKLFERRARGMLLTEYGRALLVRAQRVDAEMQRARIELAALVEKGSVRNAAIFGMLTNERRVRAFVALAEQHHMPSVAESIGITQPAVSMAVRQLEDSIGVALFERTARGMIPTPAGAALALRLKRALAEVRHAVADLARARWVLPRVNTPNRTLFERALEARNLPPPDVVVETSDLAVLRGVLLNTDLLTAISPRQLSYELAGGSLQVLPVPLPDTRR